MLSISFLGTGSGIPSSDRFFSSSMLRIGSLHLLIDAGEPCVHLMRDRGNLILEIDAVLVTHGHVDHIGGIPALLQGCMLLERKKELVIYLPEEMLDPLRAWIRALYLTEEGLGFPLLWKTWKAERPEILDGGVTVTPYPNRHLETCYRSLPGADGSRPCNSYCIEVTADPFRAVFSGDLSDNSDLATLLKKPTSVLVCELSHVSADQLAGVLQGAPLHALCLVHLSEDYADDRAELQARMEELLPLIGDVMIPVDGEVLDF